MAEPLRALVVDDSQAMRRSILLALQRLRVFAPEEAQDGIEALKKFSHAAFDIVLTDINMPMMDGLKLISHIRQGGRNATVPIVVITTEAADGDRHKALELGASAYLVKPVRAREVVDAVKQLLPVDAAAP